MNVTRSKLEKTILNEISAEEPWALVETFSKIVRLSGTDEERKLTARFLKNLVDQKYVLTEPARYPPAKEPGP